MIRRFVILLHTGHGADHMDLMIEQPRALATWQIEGTPPAGPLTTPLAAKALPDHRLAYLDYEGPVSAGRGQVQRIDSGPCEVLKCESGLWEVRFEGKVLSGLWRLCRQSEKDQWRLER